MALDQTRKLLTVACVALPCSASAQPRNASTIEAAPPVQPYDYGVQNTYDYRYNPEVRQDRILFARRATRQFCPKIQIVGESKFETEIFGLTTGKPDYAVYLKCLR
ncbi:MAG: hypothetical protein JO266_06160 [Acidobacteria bacterium]|nr:hypothetical protein [Acidobacteriota bacterium]MBV9482749.1 hypothetical protein [Acidobacteriota bacterium]